MADRKKRRQKREKEQKDALQDTIQIASDEAEEDVFVRPPVDFTLDEIDYDEAYDRVAKEPVSGEEETKKKIQRAREEAKREEKHLEKVKRKNKTRWLRVLLFTLSIIAVSLTFAWVIMMGVRDIVGMEKDWYTTVELEVLEGQTADDIAEMLGENGIISYPWLFKVVVTLDGIGDTFQTGVHEFSPHADYTEIVQELQKIPERTDIVEVTIPEGLNLVEIARKLEENGVCKADDFIQTVNTAAFDFEFIADVSTDPLKFYKMEGYLFPDRYKFYKNDTPERVAEKFFENFQNKITPYLELMKERGMTLEETITLASLIQSEAADEAQMFGISSVFHNRLNNSSAYPHLETDPATKYVEEVIKPNIDAPNQEMYDAYNTKVCNGLPVGPISSPGAKAIEAALNPESTGYYFFVHNVETGECFYATTYEQHQANCRRLGIANS
ncbi:MAG: endolytic transglycosylase MltG [Oscillospiraceae bacterium]|nr:endolytic transglycosylase MltG [Oscillospiraceae bacterium]